ncbi:MAG TPA: 4-(cytidine 5'-diphospho)-2-C-methyl-D-erythritol kinase [Pyrinomonadaceae bacterium]|nr:4-(cytidine 5'-diphospho)-2-C-methyl-D-erythritol kinase [Pyrinomonadaceae bacterium]
MSDEKFQLPAFAKINFSLRVLGRRADGYHELRTLFQTISLGDSLTFEAGDAEGVELLCPAPDIPTDESNLVLRAASALRERFGVRRGARILLEKRIPAGGGLGGGSSDAAATLVGLTRLWGLETDTGELAEIGARLGADVPFFLTGGTALGTGTGAEITPLKDLPRKCLVLVTPGVRVSTAEAFKALGVTALTKAGSAVMLPISHAEAEFRDSLCEVMTNDFEPSVFRLFPEIGRARDALKSAGAECAMLSGSGSSVFGVFENESAAERARASLAEAENGWQVFSCTTLARDEYRRAFGECAAIL